MSTPTVAGAARAVKRVTRAATCEHCGKSFKTDKPYSKTCSRKCAIGRRAGEATELRRQFVPLTIAGSAAVIPLTMGYHALVDAADWAIVSPYLWTASPAQSGKVYAKVPRNRSRRAIYLHRLIMDAPDHLEVDHKIGNGLDNRRSNLRVCTHSQNQANRIKVRGASRFKGVRPELRYPGRWFAQIIANGVTTRLGTFDSEEDAARAYDAAARKNFGEFARPNFPQGNEVSCGPTHAMDWRLVESVDAAERSARPAGGEGKEQQS